MVSVVLKLDVVGGNKVVVPGNEPPGDSVSQTLLAQWGRRYPYVDLDVALAAIPGSSVLIGSNWLDGTAGVRKKWFVLPAIDLLCCGEHPDYYQILRDLARQDDAVTEKYDACDVNDQGYCPSPGFDQEAPPEPDPFLSEGDTPSGATGYLPIIPPWMIKP